MKQFVVTYDNALLLFTQEHDGYRIESKFKGANPIAVTQDPIDTNIIYCGTFDRGLWKSDDSGETWIPIGTRFKNNDARVLEHNLSIQACRYPCLTRNNIRACNIVVQKYTQVCIDLITTK